MSQLLWWKLLLVILFGAKPVAPTGDVANLAVYGPQRAPACLELNVGTLRQVLAANPELAKLVYEGQDPAAAYEQAVAQTAGLLRVRPEDVKMAAESLRGASVWLLAFGGDGDRFRVLAVLDFGEARGVLDGLFGGLREQPGAADVPPVQSVAYGGGVIWHPGRARDPVWLAERDGKVALATDLSAVQEFLLRAAAPRPVLGSMPPPPALRLNADAEAFRNCLMAAMRPRDRGDDDFLIPALLLDVASWRRLTATFDGRRLEAQLELDPAGRMAGALAGPQGPPKLIAAIPDGMAAAAVVALEDPARLWKSVIFQGLADGFALTGQPGLERKGVVDAFQQQMGLDLERDVFGNVTEAAWILPPLERPSQWDDMGVFAFRVRDAQKARQAVAAFVQRLTGGGLEVQVAETAGGTVWSMGRDVTIAVKGETVLLSHRNAALVQAVLQALDAPVPALSARLQREHPKATSILLLNLAAFRREGAGAPGQPMLAGLWFADNRVMLTADVDLAQVARALDQALSGARASARRAACMNNLRQLAMAVHMYVADHQDQLPPDLAALGPYVPGGRLLTCPLSGKPYVYNPAVAGRVLKTVTDTAQTPLFYDAPDSHPDGGGIAYVDGHVQWWPRDQFLLMTRQPGTVPAPGPPAAQPVR